MSIGIHYHEWLENRATKEIEKFGQLSLDTHAELQSQGFDSMALERRLIQQKDSRNG